MKKELPQSDQLLSLRRNAEKKLSKEKSAKYCNVLESDAKALVHELQVHQIELEMQNEELRNANEQIENALAKYHELYELAPSGYFTISEDGKILDVNLLGSELLNVKKHYIINNYMQNFIEDDCLEIYTNFITSVFETGTRQKCEVKFNRNKLPPIYVEIQGRAMRSNAEIQNHMVVSAFDITERVEAEKIKEEARKLFEAESKRQLEETIAFDRMKTEFFSNQSHELRTPLNVIFGTLQLIELQKHSVEAETNLKLDKHLHTIRQNCLRLLRLINNIIDITKIETGFIEKNMRNGNIISIVEDVTQSVVEYIGNKGISLQFDTDVEEKVTAYDANKIERIMLNLLSNAVKFTKPGGEIKVNMYDLDDSIEISVSDTGIGIPENKMPTLFKRFHQVDMSLTREYEGSGIGLSLVKSLVEMHGGTISVVSEYGKGSEFRIKLPIRLMKEEIENRAMCEGTDQARIEKLSIEFADIYS